MCVHLGLCDLYNVNKCFCGSELVVGAAKLPGCLPLSATGAETEVERCLTQCNAAARLNRKFVQLGVWARHGRFRKTCMAK